MSVLSVDYVCFDAICAVLFTFIVLMLKRLFFADVLCALFIFYFMFLNKQHSDASGTFDCLF